MSPMLFGGHISELRSNWQFVVFNLIEPLVSENNRYFSSSQIIWSAEEIHLLLAIRGHEERPKNPERILAKTLQNMRNKNWINFVNYRGEYELRDEGYKILFKIKPTIQEIRRNKAEYLKQAEETLKQWKKEVDEFFT
jgi:hypothetical protein